MRTTWITAIKRALLRTPLLGCLALAALAASGCGQKDPEAAQQAGQPETTPAEARAFPTLDGVRLRTLSSRVSIVQDVDLGVRDTRLAEVTAGKLRGISWDGKGRQVLNGLREDPDRYRYEGTVTGTIIRKDNRQRVASYELRVVRIIAGKTDRLADAYLACKGTYWTALPVRKPDLPWEDIPATIATYKVPEAQLGVLLTAEQPLSGELQKMHGIQAAGDRESVLILTADFKPAFFGAGSMHLPKQ